MCGYVSCNSNVSTDNDNLEISTDSEFRSKVVDLYNKMADCYGQQADILKTYACSTTKANEYAYRPKRPGNITAKQYNLVRMLTGSRPITTYDDVQPNTEGLKYYNGAAQDKAKVQADKVEKSYRLMRLMTGGR